jgi:murein DD-endopeptidase MepM/ murein hydrolase activator NlpD
VATVADEAGVAYDARLMQSRFRSAVHVRLAVFLALVAFVTVPFPARASAQQSDKLGEIQRKQDENTSQIDDAEKELEGIQGQRQQLQLSIQGLAGELSLANDRLSQAQADSDRFGVGSFLLSVQVQKTQKKLEEAKAATRRSAVLLYQRSDSSAMLDLIGSADGSGDFVEGSHYLHRVSGKRHRDVQRVGTLRAELGDQQTKLEASRKLADNARDQAAGEQQRIEGIYAQQEAALANAASTEQAYNAKVADLSVQKTELAAEFQAASDEIAAALERAGDIPSYGNGRFIRPIAGAPITSPFGYRTDPITGQQALHSGIDFGAACGTPIRAAGTGVVLSAAPNDGYGNATVINHGGGLATLYGHQSAFAVSAGQVVAQGQVIGYVGSTGRSTGCHLHFEVRVNGTPVDPLGYL